VPGAGALSLGRAAVLLGDEIAVPAQDRVGSPSRRAVPTCVGRRRGRSRRALALGVGEAQAPTAEMLTQDAVLLLEVRDDPGLVAVHPARERHQI
jgi:hypothetical protein